MLFDDMSENDEELFSMPPVVEAQESMPAENLSARQTPFLWGHGAIEQNLITMLQNKRFPHGLIFSGGEGVGKSVMAYRLARYLFAKGNRDDDGGGLFGALPQEPDTSLYIEQQQPVFSRVASGGHPDLLTIGRAVDEKTGAFKQSVAVDDIRKIAPFMRMTASSAGGWRVVIVDDADTMTRSSQNGLLKILEEPPAKSLLVLITHRAGALLPTVYSRCVHIPFAPLDDGVLEKALDGRVAEDDKAIVLRMAEGSIGRAFRYAEPAALEVIRETMAILGGYPQFDWISIQNFAELFGTKGNEETQGIFEDTMLWALSSVLRRTGGGLGALQLMELEQSLGVYDALREHFRLCRTGNIDKRFLIMGAFMAFE